MDYMHDLKDLLCAELEDFAEKGKKAGKMSMGDVEVIHKLTDTVKNILKIDMLEEETGYSEDGHYMGEGRIYGTSYARGRTRAKRDSMGRYSSDDGSYRGGSSYDEASDHLMRQLGSMMEDADPKEREALKECMRAIERA